MSNAEFTFRVAVLSDLPVVVRLIEALVDEIGPPAVADRVRVLLPEDLKRALSSPQVRIFLAEHDGTAIGLSRGDILTTDPVFRLRPDHRCGYVDQMYVVPAYRDRGIGHVLLRQCEDWFRGQGITHFLLHAAPKAIRFYVRRGYRSNREMFKRL
jgi:GNAT superfamily N-acetyltransferase